MAHDAIIHGIIVTAAFALLVFRIWVTMEDGWIPPFPNPKVQTLFGQDEKG